MTRRSRPSRTLDAKYVRYLNWDVYPRLALAALYAPTQASTSGDFSLIDAELIPYLEATKGHEPVVSFAAIPRWMFKADKPVVYPDDPNQSMAFHSMRSNTQLLDPSGEQAASTLRALLVL